MFIAVGNITIVSILNKTFRILNLNATGNTYGAGIIYFGNLHNENMFE